MNRVNAGDTESHTPPNRHSAGHPREDVIVQRLGDRGVLVDLRGGAIFELNATGLRIWELLAVGTSRTDMVQKLAGEFDAPSSEIEADVDDLLQRLREARLIDP